MSAHNWTRIERLPLPLRIQFGADESPYISRRVLLHFANGQQAVGWVELAGDWAERVEGTECTYVGQDAADGSPARVVWATEDPIAPRCDPSHWRDLPPPPSVGTGYAIVAELLMAGQGA